MEVGLFLFGLLLGILLGWRWLGEKRAIVPPAHDLDAIRRRAEAAEARVRDLEAARDASDARIAAIEQERRSLADRLRSLEETLAQAKQAAAAAERHTPAVPLRAQVPDDLTRIKGIGPKLEQRLHALGITSFRQLAELTPEDMVRIDAAIEFPGRVAREHWVEQARMLMRG